MNRITQIRIKNYKSLQDVEVDLGALNVLVGKNASGKSNFLDALMFLQNIFRQNLNAAIVGQANTTSVSQLAYNYDQSQAISIAIVINYNNIEYEYKIEFYPSSDEQGKFPINTYEIYIADGVVFFERQDTLWLKKPDGIEIALQSHFSVLPLMSAIPQIEPFFEFISDMFFYEIAPSSVGYIAKTQDKQLRMDGGNFATAFKHFQETSRFQDEFQESVKKILPHIKFVEAVERLGLNAYQIGVKTHNNLQLLLPLESDGTKQTIGMLFALYQEPSPTLTAFEEPENLLHPGALAVLCDVIKESSIRNQIILTTHSPDMIARFDVNDLRIVERTSEGTKIGYLDASQREAVEQELFGSDSLLRIQGELRRQTE